jgi:chaperonin cofactor prefoldin
MINKDDIEKRLNVLGSDISNVRNKISELEQQKLESVALLNALMGAKQQCDSFLQEIDNVEPELVSDSSDVDSK